MTRAEIKTQLTALSGLTDETSLNAALNSAVAEVWNTVDIPGTLEEIRVETDSQRFITLPWQVYKVRGVKSGHQRIPHEINTIHPAYHAYETYQSDYLVRVIAPVPLAKRITNASLLTFKLKKVQDSAVSISITGEVDYASRVVEPLTIRPGQRSVTSVERYVNIPTSITKSLTVSDVDILDTDGQLLGTIPNHLTTSRYLLAQMYDRCTTMSSPYMSTFDILFKPHPPILAHDTDAFPDPYASVVVFKAMEQLKLSKEDELDKAMAYNAKAIELLKQFSADEARGKTLKRNIPADRLTTYHNVPI